MPKKGGLHIARHDSGNGAVEGYKVLEALPNRGGVCGMIAEVGTLGPPGPWRVLAREQPMEDLENSPWRTLRSSVVFTKTTEMEREALLLVCTKSFIFR
jgi:hypothetical protein